MTAWNQIRRFVRFWWQRRVRGWDDSETWNLDVEMAKWLLPRLVQFKEVTNGHPLDMTGVEWNAALDEMIYALDGLAKSWGPDEDKVDWVRVDEGLALIGKRWRDLWW